MRARKAAGATWIAGALAALVAVTGCGGNDSDGGGHGGGGFQPPPTAVEVAEAEVGPLVDLFRTVGSIEASEAITVVSEIDGTVTALPFREGSEVARGTLLARLDDRELAAEFARAEALRDQYHAQWERVRNVVEQNAGAPQDLDDAAAALKVAEANVDVARARLEKTRITAPFGGMVGPREVSPGAFLRAGQTITRLAHVSELEVHFAMPERYAGRLRLGDRVTLSNPAFPDYEVEGTVEVLDPILDADTRNLRVIAHVANPDRRFLPGMSANVSAAIAARDSAITIPADAVFAEGAEFLAYVVQADDTVVRVSLRLGLRLAGKVEVLEGLEPGARVVKAGHQKLYPGARVAPVNGGADGGQAGENDSPGEGSGEGGESDGSHAP